MIQLTKGAPLISLLKPHYELADESLLEGDVIRNKRARENVVEKFKNWLEENGYKLQGLIQPPVKGGAGNVEYLCYITKELDMNMELS